MAGNYSFVMVNLGLSQEELRITEKNCKCEILDFPFEELPPFFKHLKCILVKILSRYAEIAALRVRGYKAHGLSAILAVSTLLVFLLISGIEPNPGPNPNNGTADMENENCSSNNGSMSTTTQTTLEGLGNYMKSLMDTVTRLERTQSTLVSDMDQKLHGMGESIRQTIETSNESLRNDISRLQSNITRVDEKVDDNKERIDRLEAENDMLTKRLTDMEEELDRLEGQSRRNNVKFFGIAESVGETFQACSDKVVTVLNEFFTQKAMAGIRIASDLTRRQTAMLKEVQEDGKFGFFKNGRLHTRERREPGSETQTDNPPDADNPSSDFGIMDNVADDRVDMHATASNLNSDVSNKQPQPNFDQESTQDTEHPQHPLYSDMVASRQRPDTNGITRSSPSPTNSIRADPTTRNNPREIHNGNPHSDVKNTPDTRATTTNQGNAAAASVNGKSPATARGGRGQDKRIGGRVPGSRNTPGTTNRPSTRLQSQSVLLPSKDQPLISDRMNYTLCGSQPANASKSSRSPTGDRDTAQALPPPILALTSDSTTTNTTQQ
ncbi:hypothetical protein BaRGS_00017136, partial [Batillaria attramentaria]